LLGIEAVDQLQFAAAKANEFNVAVALNVELDAVHIGQAGSLRIMLPVVGIFAKENGGAGLVIGNVERAQDRHLFFRRVCGHDRYLIEQALEASNGCRKCDGHNLG